MSAVLPWLLVLAHAEPVFVYDEVLDEPPAERFLFLPFDVPPGTAEVRVEHTDASDANVLDWGLTGPDGFRGWQGGHGAPAVVGLAAASPGYVPGPLEGRWEVIVGFAKVEERPVRVRVEVHLADAPTLAPQPDRGPYVPPAPIRTGRAWYAGDFHVHSEQSGDASPTLDEVASAARAVGLDFVELSEHNTTAHLTLLTALQARHPDLLLLPGIEWTTYRGHANAIGVTGFVPFTVGARGLTADDAAVEVAAQGGVFAPAHPEFDLGNLCIGCAWEQEVDAVHLGGLEIQTVSADVIGLIMLDGALARWDALCDEGAHVAALGGSDDHTGGRAVGPLASNLGSPRTWVQADELSVDGVLDAVRASRTVVQLGGPDDPWVEIEGEGMSYDALVADEGWLRVVARGALGGQIVLYRDGRVDGTLEVDADPFEARVPVTPPPEGETRLRAHLLVGGIPRTITSHVWFRRPPPRPPGSDTYVEPCGCRTGPGATLPLVLALGAVAATRRRRS